MAPIAISHSLRRLITAIGHEQELLRPARLSARYAPNLQVEHDPFLTAPETEPRLAENSAFCQTLQRLRCDVFMNSPKASRLPCRHGEIRHFLEISLNSPTGVVRQAAAHILGLGRN